MKKILSYSCVVLLASTLLSCASVPAVENRLQSMQLHSNMYVIQAGETVDSIAYRYQLTPAELEALNPGLSNSIRAGLRINVIPGTELASAVRSRESSPYETVRRPELISERRNGVLGPQQQVALNDQVVVSPAPIGPELLPQRRRLVVDDSEALVAEASVMEIPASSRSNEQVVVVPESNFREEVVEDTLDFEPVQTGREAMNAELQQYVGEWAWPTDGQIAREFAPTEVGGQGVDIAGVPGQSIHAAMAGTVVYSGRDLSGGGNLIIVRHNDSLMTTYSHADKLYVAEDDQVVAGDPIASLGWNANRESVLRFEVRKDGNPLDPMKFLPLQ